MKASEMKKGQTIIVDGKLFAVVDYQHVKLGKGGAIFQTKIKSLADGSNHRCPHMGRGPACLGLVQADADRL